PSSWRSRSRPTSAPSITRSTVEDELSPSFSSSRVARTCSPSRMKAETPPAPGVSGSVRANSTIVPPWPPVVIHCFAPEIVEQPQLRQLRIQLLRKPVLAVPRRRVGLDLRLGELARKRLDLPLVCRQAEVHRAASIVAGVCAFALR